MTSATEGMMQALWLDEGKLSLRDDLPIPQTVPGEARVRVLRAGICNTDLELVRGYAPFVGIPGHEFVGQVESGPESLLGETVVGEININCGTCSTCRMGLVTHCERREVLGMRGRNGAFAEYLSLPVANLHVVPSGVSLEAATFAEPLAAALQIQEQISVGPEDRVLIVGPGKLGQLVAQTLALTGCRLEVAGRRTGQIRLPHSRSLEIAPIQELSPCRFDVVVECTGNAEGFEIARNALRPRGVLVLKSTYAGRLEIDASSIVVDEITVLGSRCGPLEKALEQMAEGRVDVEPLIGDRFPLRDGVRAFERAREPGALKVLLEVLE